MREPIVIVDALLEPEVLKKPMYRSSSLSVARVARDAFCVSALHLQIHAAAPVCAIVAPRAVLGRAFNPFEVF